MKFTKRKNLTWIKVQGPTGKKKKKGKKKSMSHLPGIHKIGHRDTLNGIKALQSTQSNFYLLELGGGAGGTGTTV